LKKVIVSFKGGRWPVKWYAPECLSSGVFSLASDVWSFGVLLWEMYTLGEAPYEDMNAAQVNEFIADGKRLPQPEKASNSVYGVMMDCWQFLPSNRPNFKDLLKFFADNPLYSNAIAQDLKRVNLET
jgi:tyrosine-protein kinase